MERPTISVTVHSSSTLLFSHVIDLEDDLELLLECQDPIRFDVDKCLIILNLAKYLPWTKYRVRQHFSLYGYMLKLEMYGRDEKTTTIDQLILDRRSKLKSMRKLCRSIVRQFMMVFGVKSFHTFKKEVTKYEPVFRAGFPSDVFYMADEPVADAILCGLEAMTLTAKQQINFDRCQKLQFQQFLDNTNIRELVIMEIEQLCLNDHKKLRNNMAVVEWHINKVFAVFLHHKQSWCYTLLRDLEMSDEDVSTIVNADQSADFVANAIHLGSIDVQTTEPDTSNVNAVCVAATTNH